MIADFLSELLLNYWLFVGAWRIMAHRRWHVFRDAPNWVVILLYYQDRHYKSDDKGRAEINNQLRDEWRLRNRKKIAGRKLIKLAA